MICCALLLLVAGGVRAVMLTLLPGRSRHEQVPFPPSARRIVDDRSGPDAEPPPLHRTAPSGVHVVGDASRRAAAHPRAARSNRRRRTLGVALVVGGIAWFAAGMVGMHLLGIVPSSIGASVWRDVAFHLSGPLVASAGLLLGAPSHADSAAIDSPVHARRTATPATALSTEAAS